MSIPLPFPEDVLEEIRMFDGNNKCCDCPSLDTDWASVSHGTLICLDCAGRHRGLGVHVSFVRSITMDTWSTQQIEMMKQGGNAQIRRFFKRLEIDNSPLQTLYCTKAAEHYREKLRERVDKVLSGEIVSEKRSKSEKMKIQHPTSPPLPPPPPSKSITANVITARFGAGPMGMTLTKDYRDQAYISKLVPGGQAQQQGIKVGDIVISVAGKTMGSYDEIMHMIPLMPRPLELVLTRVEATAHAPEPIHHSKSDTALLNMHRDLQPTAPSSTNVSTPVVPVPSIRGTKLSLDLKPSTATESKSKAKSHPMKQATKAVQLLRKGMKGVEVADDDEDNDSDEGGSDDEDDEDDENEDAEEDDEDNQQEQEHDNDHQEAGAEGGEEAADKSPSDEAPSGNDATATASTGSPSDQKSSKAERNPLEPGSVIKVLKVDSGKWKTAMIKRRHKDNTFKVIYKDGSEESHIPISRLALSTPATVKDTTSSQGSATIPPPTKQTNNQRSAYEDALFESMERDKQSRDVVANTDDFVVEAEESLDAWIERDFRYDLTTAAMTSEDSYFAPKDITMPTPHVPAGPSGKDRDLKSIAGGDYSVEFVAAPLGLTLSANPQHEPEVIRLREGGNAFKEGVQVGDVVVLINNIPVRDYEEAMQMVSAAVYPLVISFRRPPRSIMAESSDVLLRNSKILATQLMGSMGLSKDSILSSGNKHIRLSNARNTAIPGGSTASSNGSSSFASSSSSAKAAAASLQPPVRSRLELNPGPNQFDVQFEQEELGFRVQERMGAQIVSVVVDVTDRGEAKSKGVSVGCVVAGINYEPYLSHAHTVATLKYAKRPVVIRFIKS